MLRPKTIRPRRSGGGATSIAVPFAASAGCVFRALADVESFPRWAAEFCERVELSRGRWLALTVAGDLFIELTADERSGVIDVRLSDERGRAFFLPLRVVALPGGQTIVSALLEPSIEREHAAMMKRALGGLARALAAAPVALAGGISQAPRRRPSKSSGRVTIASFPSGERGHSSGGRSQ